jgi:predicted aspartyl protease
VFALVLGAAAADPGRAKDLEAADALFKAGKFAQAEKLYARVAAAEPKNDRAVLRVGQVALLANRLDRARTWLEKAVSVRPKDVAARLLLAEVFYRRDDFAAAAAQLRAAGKEARARQLESFRGRTPYAVEGEGERTALKLVVTDPLPLVRVRVNGGAEVNFFIDTGAAEVVLDTDFAREIGVKTFGADVGTFAGGKKASYGHGRIDSLAVGGFTVKNVPVGILNTRQFSRSVFAGRRVDGIIGTVLLYHFRSTLDYPRGQLVLWRNTAENRRQLAAAARADGSMAVPFWMGGDHYRVAWARVDRAPPVLLFVDTGLAGGGVVLAESVLKEAGIKLDERLAGEGVGGGGKARAVPFVVKELSLGGATEKNVRGVFTGPFPLEHAQGFRIGGIISHGFFRPYALTFDFTGMRLLLKRES